MLKEGEDKRSIYVEKEEREREKEERFHFMQLKFLWSSIHHEKGEVTSSSLLMFLSHSSVQKRVSFSFSLPSSPFLHSRPEKCLCSWVKRENFMFGFRKRKPRWKRKRRKNVSSTEMRIDRHKNVRENKMKEWWDLSTLISTSFMHPLHLSLSLSILIFLSFGPPQKDQVSRGGTRGLATPRFVILL